MDGKILVVKHVRNEGPGLIKSFFEGHGRPVHIIDLSDNGELPESMDDAGAVVMLGGPINVYEEERYPFLQDEDRFIARLVPEDIPFSGICLGAQLLLKACGAQIMKSNTREIGWHEVDVGKIRADTTAVKDFVEEQAQAILFNFKRLIEPSLRFKRIMKQYVEDGSRTERRAICWWENELKTVEADAGV